MIGNLRVFAAVAMLATLALAGLSADSIGITAAGLVALSILPFALGSKIWRRDPDITFSIFLGVLVGYALRLPILESNLVENFARTVRIPTSVRPISMQRLVTARLLIAVMVAMAILAVRSYRSSVLDKPATPATADYSAGPLLALAALWMALSAVAANRFGATAPLIAFIRALIPSTVILAAAIATRLASSEPRPKQIRRMLDLAIVLLVLAGVAQGRQSLLVLPLVLWLPLALRNNSSQRMRRNQVARAALVGTVLVVAGGWAVSVAEATLKGNVISTEFSIVEAVGSISDRTATFDRELAVAAINDGGPTSDNIDVEQVLRTSAARLLPGIDLGGNDSMGREFAVELQRRRDDQRQEGAWGWIAGAVEIGGRLGWPLVIGTHLIAVALLLDYFGRRPDALVLQIVAGNMLVLQWLPSGNLDRLWSGAIRELILGAILLRFIQRPQAPDLLAGTARPRTAARLTG